MNIEYKKIFNKNYVILSDCNIADYKECYRSKMLKSNHLDNFLPYDTRIINGSFEFTYDISSKQCIDSFYENSEFDYQTSRHIIMSLKSAFDTLNNYLLEPDYIILNPSLIYMNLATKAIYFCYCPGEKKDFYLSLKDFLSYLLSKIDHTDNNSIVLAYSLQQQTLSENYTFDDIINILNKPVFHHTSETEHTPPAFASDNKSIPLSDQTTASQPPHPSSTPENEPDTLQLSSINPNLSGNPSGFTLNKTLLFCFGVYFILTCGIGFYGLILDNLSLETVCIIVLILGVAFFYLYNFLNRTLDKPALFKESLSDNLPGTIELPTPDSTYPDIPVSPTFPIFSDDTANTSMCDTVLLGSKCPDSVPKLIYTGTDFESINELTHFPYIIGKFKDNVNMVISHPMISRIHAKVHFQDGHYYLEDMNSSNGTYLNMTLIQPHTLTEIHPGDQITFAHLTYIFQ